MGVFALSLREHMTPYHSAEENFLSGSERFTYEVSLKCYASYLQNTGQIYQSAENMLHLHYINGIEQTALSKATYVLWHVITGF